MSYSLQMYDPIKVGTAPLGNVTAQMRNWRRLTRAIGGFWQASGDFWLGDQADDIVDVNQAEEMFNNGLGRRIVEEAGPVTWDGIIWGMTLTKDGRTRVRSFDYAANMVQAVYARFGNDLLMNGSAEIATTNYGYHSFNGIGGGAQPTITRVPRSTWAAHGDWSWQVDTTDCTANAGIALEASPDATATRTYRVTGWIKVTINNFAIVEIKVGGVLVYTYDTGQVTADTIAYVNETFELQAGVSGTTAVRVYTGEDTVIWVDGFSLREAGTQCRTAWIGDANSIARYGTIERILLDAGNTDAAALQRVAGVLAEGAWMWPRPPESEEISGDMRQPDGLKIDLAGFVRTLPFKSYAGIAGPGDASTHVTNVIAASEFLTAGVITANTLSTYIEDQESVLAWDVLEKIIRSGDASGNAWIGGVGAERKFDYQLRPTTIDYLIRGGQWCTADGNLIEPELVRPGFVLDESWTPVPGTATGDPRDDPRVYYMDEVEFVAPATVIPHYVRDKGI